MLKGGYSILYCVDMTERMRCRKRMDKRTDRAERHFNDCVWYCSEGGGWWFCAALPFALTEAVDLMGCVSYRPPLAFWVARVEARPHFVLYSPLVGAWSVRPPVCFQSGPSFNPCPTLAAGSSPAPRPIVGCLIFPPPHITLPTGTLACLAHARAARLNPLILSSGASFENGPTW